MKKPEKNYITVGVLCFNTGKYVINTLDSVLNQTYKNFELIIVDDCSNDNSCDLIEKWINERKTKCHFIKHKKNLGINKTLNEVSHIAKGDYLSLVGDDIWDDDFLETCMSAYSLPEAKNSSLVYTFNRIIFEKDGKIVDGYNPIETCNTRHYPRISQLFKEIIENIYLLENPFLTDILFWFNPVIGISACIRIDHLKSTGGYDEKLSYEDYDMWFKLSEKGSFIYVNKTCASYIQNNLNFSSNRKFDLNADEIKVLLKNFKKIEFNDTKTYCINKAIFKLFSLKQFKNEKTIIYRNRTRLLLAVKIFKFAPLLFLKSIVHPIFNHRQNAI